MVRPSVAVASLGTALASWPLSRSMVRFGRRPGLTIGYALAVTGALLGILGVMHRSFAAFLGGMALFGTAQTSNLLARYAAADISAGAQRGRAMGLIVWGSAAGSIVGPHAHAGGDAGRCGPRHLERRQRVFDLRRGLCAGGHPRTGAAAARSAGDRATDRARHRRPTPCAGRTPDAGHLARAARDRRLSAGCR